MRLVEQCALQIETRINQSEHASKGRSARDHPIRMDGIQRQQSLAHVKHRLRNPDAKHVPRLLAVKLAQLTQQPRHARVVRPGTRQPHGQNGILGNLRIGIVGHPRQLVDDAKVRIGNVEHSQGEWHGALHGKFAVVEQVLEGSESHFGSYFLSHRDEADSDDCGHLVFGILLEMFGALVEHFLYLQYVAAARVGTRFQNNGGKFGNFVFNRP
mmetsp:Transcript_28465/g.51438  ORF Transcript_28465/g.51438 Transcript_28465/m.51438 type:complete len:213 (+) Transcript_28465:395-1033(+)